MTSNDHGEVVAAGKKRRMKPRSKWKKYHRPGKGELLSIEELAGALGENVRTIRNWRARGLIPTLVLGHRSLRFRLDAVLAALEKRQIKKRHFYQQPL